MWSGEGGVDERGGEGRGSPAHPPPDLVSSSTSPSPAVVDLSLKTTSQGCSLSSAEEGGERIAGTSTPPTSTTSIQTGPKEFSSSIKEVFLEMTSRKNGHANALQGCSSGEEGGDGALEVAANLPTSTSSQAGLREFSSVKEVLLEMTNRKNGHAKLPPARWGIMKKEDQVLLKVPKFVVDDKKGAFPRPTAFVNPFPADSQPPNGSASLQTSIKDWLNGTKNELPPKLTRQCNLGKPSKMPVRQRFPRGSTIGRGGRKRPLTSIVAQLAGNFQNSHSPLPLAPTNPETVQPLIKPGSEPVTFLSPHRLSGGEVSITEVSPDLNVVDRLKRLGTVIEVEAEKDSLKLLEKMTKSVVKDAEINASSKTVKQPSKPPPNSRQSSKQRSKLQTPQELTKNPPLQLTVPNEMPIITLINVPSEQPVQQSLDLGQPSKCQSFQPSVTPKQLSISQPLPATGQTSLLPAIQTSVSQLSSDHSPKVQTQINQPLPCEQPLPAQSSQVKIINQTSNQNSHQSSSQQPLKDLPILISLTPKIQFAQRNKPFAVKMSKPKTPSKAGKVSTPKLQQQSITSSQLSLPSTPITAPVYISKDVTLIPKPLPETIHDKIEPSLLEPVIDIVEEENVLAPDGTFLFKTDSFHNIDLPNDQKVFSCDICSAVYTHSNMMRKHYLRLHIARKYISEKDMETFNIDPEPSSETVQDNLIFRCHTCRECFPTKNDLRSHLTDHPPVDELAKQNNKPHPTYKCDNCSAVFKWRKQFGRHKKLCKSSPPPVSEKPDLYHCLYCNETFLNANAKRNHILSNHPYVRRKHCCVFCKRDGFPTNVSLFTHLLNDHPTVYFACQICKERFTNLEDLRIHIDKRHDQDDKLKASMSERVSTIKQDKIFYSCDTCQRKFLIESSFNEHVCFPEKQEKPKLQKIKKKVSHSERAEQKTVDLETLFFSRVARNVRENLLHHLDGKIYKEDSSSDDDGINDSKSSNNSRTFLNFSDGFPSSSEILMDHSGADTPTRVKAPWEKYNFPKNYDGRCGLTSYIKDTAYLDISTQLIMRRNLQRLNMLPMRESPSDDVPSAVALERLGAECAESFGQLKKEEKKAEGTEEEVVSLSGEWVRERMYVCSACRWETPCLWTMEDHKYLAHPRVHCPQHELIGELASLSQTIYKRLVVPDEPLPFLGPMPPAPPSLDSLSCTKCEKSGFSNQTDLHIHILECAGVVVEAVGPPAKKRRRRSRRRPRRGLKRNIPQTPQKMPPKQRTKPGDTDTIQRMIANLPAKRISRKVLSSFDENRARHNAQKNKAVKGAKNKKTKEAEKRSQSEPPLTPTKEQEKPIMFQKPTIIRKEQDYIDTSAEGGDVLSSLRMMPVRSARVSAPALPFIESIPAEVTEVKDDAPSLSQSEDKEMPKLEIEKDISPVESTEIPVLSPVDSTGKEVKKEKDDSVSEVSFNDDILQSDVVTPVSNDAENVPSSTRKRKSTGTPPNGPRKKKPCKPKSESPGKKQPKETAIQEHKIDNGIENILPEMEPPSITEVEEFDNPPVLKRSAPKAKGKRNSKPGVKKVSSEVISSASDLVSPDGQEGMESVTQPSLKQTSPKQRGKKTIVKAPNSSNDKNEVIPSPLETIEAEKPAVHKPDSSKPKTKKSKKSIDNAADEKVSVNIPPDPEISESEKAAQPISTPSKQRRRKSSKIPIAPASEEVVSSADDINSFAPDLLDSEKPPAIKVTSIRQKGKRGSKANLDIVSDENVSSAGDVISSSPNTNEVDKPSPMKSTPKQRGKKLLKGSAVENISTNGDINISPVNDVLDSEKLPILKSNSVKQKGKKSSKTIMEVGENNVTSASEETSLASDITDSSKPKSTKATSAKQKNRKSLINKSLIEPISDENVSSASDIISSVQDVSVEEKPPISKAKGKKKSKGTDESNVDNSAPGNDSAGIKESSEFQPIAKSKNKKSTKRSKDNSDENATSSIIIPLQVSDIAEVSPVKLRGKKSGKNVPSIEVSESSNVKENKQSPQEETSIPEEEKPLPKQRGRKSIKQTPPARNDSDSPANDKDEAHILTKEIDVEKDSSDITSNKQITIKKEKAEVSDTVSIKRGPGRPKGTLIRRITSGENRRSNRRFINNNLNVKYDEILPCEEDEVQEVKKPEKPARKPRTIKEQPSSDSTTIVVEVEVHPEPILKRKIADVSFKDDCDKDVNPVPKKPKDEDQDILTETTQNPDSEKNSEGKALEISEINSQVDSSCNQINMPPSQVSPNKSKEIIELTENHSLNDKNQLKELKFDKKKIEASAQSPSKGVTCYNSPTIEKEIKIDTSQKQSKGIDIYEFVDNDIIEDCLKDISEINNEKEVVLETNEAVPLKYVPSEKAVTLESNETISEIDKSPDKNDESDAVNNILDSNVDINVNEESNITNENEIDIPLKKKKLGKKANKSKKKEAKLNPGAIIEDNSLQSASEVDTSNLEGNEKSNDMDKEKLKKTKKQRKDINEALEIKKNLSLKKDTLDLQESKKLKKLVKKKKVIKKVIKGKKLHKPQKSSELVNIAGFTWEVSELETPPVEEFSSPPQPDSSVDIKEEELKIEEETPVAPSPPPPSVPLQAAPLPPPSLPAPLVAPQPTKAPLQAHPKPSPAPQQPPPAAIQPPPAQVSTASSVPVQSPPVLPASSLQFPTPRHPPPSSTQTWDAPWEQNQPDPSIGTILDSVNKVLNYEAENNETILGLPSYSLADLQKAMGASDAEMAVLQQLGEASLQISSTDEVPCATQLMKTCESDDWNGEKCIMDLDSHTPLKKETETLPAPAPTPISPPVPEVPTSETNSGVVNHYEEDWRWREKSPEGGSSSLLEAHQGKEVLCPSCSCHFMGFPALQKHLAKSHPTIDPTSKQKRGAGTPFIKTDLNRLMPLDSSKGPRLICFTCQQILPSDRMGLHLDQEHDIAPEEVSKCASLSGETHDGPVIGERLKSKMSLKLGDLLDRAVNNLLQAKHKPNNTLSGGAVELLTKLCAVRKREGSVKHRLHGARELLSKLQRQQEMKDDVEEVKVVKKLFSCSICGLKFSLPSSRNKHEVLAHRSYRPVERDYDEYENDWREAPSPPDVSGENGETAITPQCSDCGLSFDSIQDMMRHRVEDHSARRPSVDTVNTAGTGCCPSPVPSSAGSRSQPDSEGEVGEGGGESGPKTRGIKFRKHGLSRNGSKLVKEKAEAALRELNHLRQRPSEGRRWALKTRANEVYNFTDDSL